MTGLSSHYARAAGRERRAEPVETGHTRSVPAGHVNGGRKHRVRDPRGERRDNRDDEWKAKVEPREPAGTTRVNILSFGQLFSISCGSRSQPLSLLPSQPLLPPVSSSLVSRAAPTRFARMRRKEVASPRRVND